MLEWAKLFENRKYKIIKQEILPSGKWVSTVWLGLNHSLEGGTLIFETMVFASKKDMSEVDMNRYSTEEEALKDHQEMVKKYQ